MQSELAYGIIMHAAMMGYADLTLTVKALASWFKCMLVEVHGHGVVVWHAYARIFVSLAIEVDVAYFPWVEQVCCGKQTALP